MARKCRITISKTKDKNTKESAYHINKCGKEYYKAYSKKDAIKIAERMRKMQNQNNNG